MLQRILAIILMFTSFSLFALDLELTQGINSALPIAINSFGQDNMAKEITSVVKNDLKLSGQFKIISDAQGANGRAGLDILKRLGADSAIIGQVTALGSNRYQIHYSLQNTQTQQTLLTQSFQVDSSQMRRLAHHISDEVFLKLTGLRGIFSTRIAYISVKRGRNTTRYSLEVADADGYHPQSLLSSSEPIMSPSWSPDGRSIAYVSFEKKRAQIYTVSVMTGKRRLISSFPGINGAPAWSPDGKELAIVLSKDGTPKIYTVNLSSGSMKQITFGNSIDTEPRYAPDGKSILFTSGRGGTPQVYRLSLATGKATRVTYDGNYNARASYTPDMQNIVMLHRDDSKFTIGLQDAAGGAVASLTFSGADESPSVSPNSKLILYATRYQDRGVLGVVSIDGRIHLRLPSTDGDVQEPAWSPFLS